MEDRTFDRISRGLAGTSTRRQALKFLGGGLVGGTIAATGIAGLNSAAARPPQVSGLVAPIEFVSTDGGSFFGGFAIDRFVSSSGVVQAVGTLTGEVLDAPDGSGSVEQPLTLDLLPSSFGTCQILHLELGPLDLDLLGLVIHLDQVVLDITAESGPGNLLGNLLCGIAGLLDSGVTGGALARLLNQLLGLLG